MAVRYVDDGGNNSDGTSWANAYTSINSLIAAEASFLTTGGNIVYFGHDHVCQATNSANLTITGPSSGTPVLFVSVTQGTTTYQKGTTSQIDTSEGAYNLVFDGSFFLQGMYLRSGGYVEGRPDSNETFVADDCTFRSASTSYPAYFASSAGFVTLKNCVLDLSDLASLTHLFYISGHADISGMSLANASGVNVSNMFGYVSNGSVSFSGCDFSALDAGTRNLFSGYTAIVNVSNSKLPSTYAANGVSNMRVFLEGSGVSGDEVTSLYYLHFLEKVISTTAIYRTDGQEIEGTPVSWSVITGTYIADNYWTPLPWIYGYLDSTGSKNFDVFITNDSADFDNDEVWLEVEYKASSGSGVWTRVDDSIATVLATPAAQDDDTSSTWNGTGPSFTYKQRLRVTATVNQIGQYRARVCVAKPSIAAGSYFYIDPLVVIS